MSTFHTDFKIAEVFGVEAIKDTWNRAFAEWKTDYKMLTDLVICVNERCWLWYEKKNNELSELYSDFYYKGRDYALDNLKGEEFQYYYRMTD